MTTYPGLPGPRITDHVSREQSREHYQPGTEFNIGRIEMVANTGTYLDTPFHRFPDGYDLADLPLERVADLPGVCIVTEGQEIGPEAVSATEIAGKAVLFATGWDRHWGTSMYGDPTHPYVSEAVVELLVQGGASLVGIDSVNIDDTRGGSRPVHTRLLESGIPLVEHLTGLDALIGVEFRFSAVPAPVRGMGTFPVRAYAIV
jgi:arylformamidase